MQLLVGAGFAGIAFTIPGSNFFRTTLAVFWLVAFSSALLEEMDEQAAGLNIVTKPTDATLTTVMSNSFGFGGTNATLVMRKLKA